MPADDFTQPSFGQRYFAVRRRLGPLVMGIDPSKESLAAWGLEDSPVGLKEFCAASLEVASSRVGLVKFQSAFFERQGWRGMRVLSEAMQEARSNGLLVILDVKRSDIGSTAFAYGEAFFNQKADFFADAVTLTPYLGVEELMPVFRLAAESGGYVFVVARSSNDGARSIQQVGSEGLSVEETVLKKIRSVNQNSFAGIAAGMDHRPGVTGPVGAVFAPNCPDGIGVDLAELGCLFLAPGIGAQGATMKMTAEVFSSCKTAVLPSVSRAVLSCGPDRKAMFEAVEALAKAAEDSLG